MIRNRQIPRRAAKGSARRLLAGAALCGAWIVSGALHAQATDTTPPDTAKFYGRTPAESSPPTWPSLPSAPKGAPNVLVILTDDVGFGASSTFGGPIPTPTFDALAQAGARYNAFNTSAICSPTRASLLTGRNPQAVGMGYVANWPTGYAGYNSVIPKSAGTVAQILRKNGYSTAMFGKGHITPEWEISAAGPFDRWPTGLGFDYFYGFLGADTSMFEPTLVENTSPIEPPRDDPDYHLDRDLADRAIDWISTHRSTAPDKPFFIYYATGTAHAPNHAPKEWLEKFRGKFDAGWDVQRQQTVARQKAIGIIPPDTADAARPEGLARWSTLSPEQKRLYARYMEAYAAQLAYADDQIGRIIEQLRREGELDNTMIVFIQGDNGASEEGGIDGRLFEQSGLSGVVEQRAYAQQHIDDIGKAASYSLNVAGWGWALNAPFPWAKHYASHFGGTRNGMVIAWPSRIRNPELVRTQFHHVSDIMPTIFDAAGITPPEVLDGVPQQPITGISMRYTFDNPTAPSHRTTQVFAIEDNLAIYKDGWVAATKPTARSWDMIKSAPVGLDDRVWQLYDIRSDFSEARDLAKANSRKLAQLKDLFWAEAARTNMLPIHGYAGVQHDRPALKQGRTSFTYRRPATRIPESAAPSPVGRSFTITARISLPADGGNGVLVAQGGRYAGYSFYLDKGKPMFTYSLTPAHLTRIGSADALGAGDHLLIAEFKSDTETVKSGGLLTISVDGQLVAEGRIEQTFAQIISHTEGFDVGMDGVTAVDPRYTVPTSKFTGVIDQIDFELK